MRKFITLALVVGAVLWTTTAAAAVKEWRYEECRFGSLQQAAWTVREIELTIRCATQKWDVAGGYPKALDVAYCESGSDLKDPGGDGYVGTYQHAERYWPARVRNLAPAAWNRPLSPSGANPRSNVVVAIRMAHAGGWGPWTCA